MKTKMFIFLKRNPSKIREIENFAVVSSFSSQLHGSLFYVVKDIFPGGPIDRKYPQNYEWR